MSDLQNSRIAVFVTKLLRNGWTDFSCANRGGPRIGQQPKYSFFIFIAKQRYVKEFFRPMKQTYPTKYNSCKSHDN